MRNAIISAKPYCNSTAWKYRVMAMTPNMVLAIYKDFVKRGIIIGKNEEGSKMSSSKTSKHIPDNLKIVAEDSTHIVYTDGKYTYAVRKGLMK